MILFPNKKILESISAPEEQRCSHDKIIFDCFCQNCSVIKTENITCLKHQKYDFTCSEDPREIFTQMNNSTITFTLDQKYLELRKDIIWTLRKITSKFNFKSQTLFSAILYTDIIFSKGENKKEILINLNSKKNYFILALSCLLIAAKYEENDHLFPSIRHFIQFFLNFNFDCAMIVTSEMLVKAEIESLKNLQYKLNYFSIYHWISFFFCYGIISKEQLESYGLSDLNSTKIKKLLEKIYIKARDYLDKIIDTKFTYQYSNNNLLISYVIFEKAINETLTAERNSKEKKEEQKTPDINEKHFRYILENIFNYKLDEEQLEKLRKEFEETLSKSVELSLVKIQPKTSLIHYNGSISPLFSKNLSTFNTGISYPKNNFRSKLNPSLNYIGSNDNLLKNNFAELLKENKRALSSFKRRQAFENFTGGQNKTTTTQDILTKTRSLLGRNNSNGHFRRGIGLFSSNTLMANYRNVDFLTHKTHDVGMNFFPVGKTSKIKKLII